MCPEIFPPIRPAKSKRFRCSINTFGSVCIVSLFEALHKRKQIAAIQVYLCGPQDTSRDPSPNQSHGAGSLQMQHQHMKKQEGYEPSWGDEEESTLSQLMSAHERQDSMRHACARDGVQTHRVFFLHLSQVYALLLPNVSIDVYFSKLLVSELHPLISNEKSTVGSYVFEQYPQAAHTTWLRIFPPKIW